MKRRDFITKSISAGILTGAAFTFGKFGKVFAESPKASPNAAYDLVAVKGGAPDVMFDKGIAALGGMDNFVKKGQTVLVKPNIGWDVIPEKAANTNPLLVKRIVEKCFTAGASEVYVFDNTCDKWQNCYKNSGIENAVNDAGGKIVPGNAEKYYQEVEIPKGKKLTKAKVHEKVLEADVFINVPVLKNHRSAKLTIAMKNLMGIVWNRRYWHLHDLHQCIADFCTYKKMPHLNVVDAYNVMLKNGPRGVSKQDVVQMKSQLLSTDIVAVDSAAEKIFASVVNDAPAVDYIKIAHDMGIGRKDLENLNIKRIKI